MVVHDEKLFKRHPWLLYASSVLVAVSLEAIDVGLVAHNSIEDVHKREEWEEELANNGTEGPSSVVSGMVPSSSTTLAPVSPAGDIGEGLPTARIPVLSLYNHLVIYIFLPLPRKDVAVLMGLCSSFSCLATCITIDVWGGVSQDRTEFARQVMADVVFYATLNFVGLYVRYVGEINMRRGFLDKRGCIETTFKLKYEKEQEENLLLSIIPKHIATQVKEKQQIHNLLSFTCKSKCRFLFAFFVGSGQDLELSRDEQVQREPHPVQRDVR